MLGHGSKWILAARRMASTSAFTALPDANTMDRKSPSGAVKAPPCTEGEVIRVQGGLELPSRDLVQGMALFKIRQQVLLFSTGTIQGNPLVKDKSRNKSDE